MNTTTYAIYDLTTGAVRWFMTSEPDHIDGSTPSGCGWIEVDSIPNGGWHVDLESKVLVEGALDLRTLEQVKADQWETVKAARDAALNGTFNWNGMVFDADEVSQQRIQGAVQLATLAASDPTFTIGWTLHDNTTSTLSGTDLINVGKALGTFVQTIFAKGVSLRAQINAATTAADVKAISWA